MSQQDDCPRRRWRKQRGAQSARANPKDYLASSAEVSACVQVEHELVQVGEGAAVALPEGPLQGPPTHSISWPPKPMLIAYAQVKDELAQVEDTNLGDGGNSDSFARVFYSREAEYAVNEQIK